VVTESVAGVVRDQTGEMGGREGERRRKKNLKRIEKKGTVGPWWAITYGVRVGVVDDAGGGVRFLFKGTEVAEPTSVAR